MGGFQHHGTGAHASHPLGSRLEMTFWSARATHFPLPRPLVHLSWRVAPWPRRLASSGSLASSFLESQELFFSAARWMQRRRAEAQEHVAACRGSCARESQLRHARLVRRAICSQVSGSVTVCNVVL